MALSRAASGLTLALATLTAALGLTLALATLIAALGLTLALATLTAALGLTLALATLIAALGLPLALATLVAALGLPLALATLAAALGLPLALATLAAALGLPLALATLVAALGLPLALATLVAALGLPLALATLVAALGLPLALATLITLRRAWSLPWSTLVASGLIFTTLRIAIAAASCFAATIGVLVTSGSWPLFASIPLTASVVTISLAVRLHAFTIGVVWWSLSYDGCGATEEKGGDGTEKKSWGLMHGTYSLSRCGRVSCVMSIENRQLCCRDFNGNHPLIVASVSWSGTAFWYPRARGDYIDEYNCHRDPCIHESSHGRARWRGPGNAG